ncbi:MAG: hypothetical protein HOW73_16935 [Polyangiaceae bacterium]|nr:hypothetical protein [Polyangiaceae bacterium]
MQKLSVGILRASTIVAFSACGFDEALAPDEGETPGPDAVTAEVPAPRAEVAPVQRASAGPSVAVVSSEPAKPTITQQPDPMFDRMSFHAKLIERLRNIDRRLKSLKSAAEVGQADAEREPSYFQPLATLRGSIDKDQLELSMIPEGAWSESRDRIDADVHELEEAIARVESEMGVMDGPSGL